MNLRENICSVFIFIALLSISQLDAAAAQEVRARRNERVMQAVEEATQLPKVLCGLVAAYYCKPPLVRLWQARLGGWGDQKPMPGFSDDQMLVIGFERMQLFDIMSGKLLNNRLIDPQQLHMDTVIMSSDRRLICGAFMGKSYMRFFQQSDDGTVRALKRSHGLFNGLRLLGNAKNILFASGYGVESRKVYLYDLGSRSPMRDENMLGDTEGIAISADGDCILQVEQSAENYSLYKDNQIAKRFTALKYSPGLAKPDSVYFCGSRPAIAACREEQGRTQNFLTLCDQEGDVLNPAKNIDTDEIISAISLPAGLASVESFRSQGKFEYMLKIYDESGDTVQKVPLKIKSRKHQVSVHKVSDDCLATISDCADCPSGTTQLLTVWGPGKPAVKAEEDGKE